jgi:hypothetical protein
LKMLLGDLCPEKSRPYGESRGPFFICAPSMLNSSRVQVTYPACWWQTSSEAQGHRREAGAARSVEQSHDLTNRNPTGLSPQRLDRSETINGAGSPASEAGPFDDANAACPADVRDRARELAQAAFAKLDHRPQKTRPALRRPGRSHCFSCRTYRLKVIANQHL